MDIKIEIVNSIYYLLQKRKLVGLMYTNIHLGGTHLGEVIYNSKEEAENNAKVYETDINTYITTIKIE